jgi:hypothetical protein
VDRVKSFAVAVKAELVSALSSLGSQLVWFNKTREEEEAEHEANLQKIREDASLDTQAALDAALAAEEARFDENRTTVTGIWQDTWDKLYQAVVDAAIGQAAQLIVDTLWNVFVPGVAGAMTTATTAVQTGVLTMQASLLSLLAPVAAIAGAIAVILDLISGKATIAGSIGHWLDDLFGIRQGGNFGPEGTQYLHGGGIVAGSLGEEPVIRTKAGEGVFTPEQMAAMGTIDYGLLGEAVRAGVADGMQEASGDASRPLILQVDGKTFGRIALPLIQYEKLRLGLEAV